MQILFTSTSYPRTIDDWRGIFVRNLVLALARQANIRLNVWAPPGPLPSNVRYACTAQEADWLDRLALKGGIAHVLKTGHLSRIQAPLRLVQFMGRAYRREQADIFHANWLQSVLPMGRTHTPAVVSVLGTDFGLLKLPGMTKVLRRSIQRRRCVITPNAEWMLPRLVEFFGDVAEVVPVPFGIDESWYRVQRRVKQSQPGKWLVVSRVTRAKIGPLFEWGRKVFGADNELHLFGPMQEPLTLPDWVHYHGPMDPGRLAAEWFPQAAGLLTLSQHDEGRPQVLLEAMAAGLPVLASRLPAHEGLVRHRLSGWLCGNEEEFRAGMRWLSEPDNNSKSGEEGRMWVRRDMGTWDDCAGRYLRVYRMLLEQK